MVYPNRVVLNINQKYVMPIPYTQQGDTARVLTFNILDKGVPFNLTGKTVRAKILKPDNTKCYNDLTITNATGGECDLKLTNQVLAVAGKVNCQLEIKEGEELLSTIIFPIDVEPSIDINGAVESTNEFTALLNGIIKLDEWDKYFKETSGAIEEKYTERLNGINSSLEESKDINMSKFLEITNPIGHKKPFFTFIDDDGRYTFNSILKAIFEEKGVKCNLAINPSYVGDGSHFTWDELRQLQDEGYEIISHGWDHKDFDTMTDEQLVTDCEKVKKAFNDNEISYKNICVLPNNKQGNTKIVKKYYDFCFGNTTTGNNHATLPLDSMRIARCNIEGYTLDQLKARVDNAIANNAYLNFMIHSWMPAFQTPQKQQDIKDLIDYIKSKGCEIGVASKARSTIGNNIEYGTLSDSMYFILTNYGELYQNSVDFKYIGFVSDLNKLPNLYDGNKVTLSRYGSNTPGAPNTSGGWMLTFKDKKDNSNTYTVNIAFSIGNTVNHIYKQTFNNSTNLWNTWVQLTGNRIEGNNVNIDRPITDYPVNTVTINRISTGYNTPDGKAGYYKTYRHDNDQYSYQEWEEYKTHIKKYRNWNTTTGSWDAWL